MEQRSFPEPPVVLSRLMRAPIRSRLLLPPKMASQPKPIALMLHAKRLPVLDSRPTSRPSMPMQVICSGFQLRFRVTPSRSGQSAKAVLTTLPLMPVRSMYLAVTTTECGARRASSGPSMPIPGTNSGSRSRSRMTPSRSGQSAKAVLTTVNPMPVPSMYIPVTITGSGASGVSSRL